MTIRDTVDYEWTVEERDENGDITTSDFDMKLKGLLHYTPTYGGRLEYALMRRLGSDYGGEVDRQYAYVEDGKLPEFFDGGDKVPQRFHRELAAAS